jgi:hypothetical protein
MSSVVGENVALLQQARLVAVRSRSIHLIGFHSTLAQIQIAAIATWIVPHTQNNHVSSGVVGIGVAVGMMTNKLFDDIIHPTRAGLEIGEDVNAKLVCKDEIQLITVDALSQGKVSSRQPPKAIEKCLEVDKRGVRPKWAQSPLLTQSPLLN